MRKTAVYDSRYVRFEWCTGLMSDTVLLANSIFSIKQQIAMRKEPVPCREGSELAPFVGEDGNCYTFAYCDPFLSVKYALDEGRDIEVWSPRERRWRPVEIPGYFHPRRRYRVRPDD